MSDNKKELFNHALKEIEKTYSTRPEFIYRINRRSLNSNMQTPLAVTLRNHTGGWALKGFALYFVYYVLFTRSTEAPYLNRQGYYNYDSGHHTSQMGPFPN